MANHSLQPTPRTARFGREGAGREYWKASHGTSGAAELKAVRRREILIMNDYDPRVKLRAMFPKSPGKYNFSDNDAISMMVFTRELLEKSKDKSKFPVLNLFCNWTVHTELEGSISAYRILAAITDIFLSTNDQDERAHLISQELSSTQLRQELIKLYTTYRIPTHIFESAATWTMFGRHFFKAVLGKRLRYPPNPSENPRSNSIYNAMMSPLKKREDKSYPNYTLLKTGKI